MPFVGSSAPPVGDRLSPQRPIAEAVNCWNAEPRRKIMTWETPEYTVIDVCAEVTGYYYQR